MKVKYLGALAMASVLGVSLTATGCSGDAPCAGNPCATEKTEEPCAGNPCAAADPCAPNPCASN